MPAGVKGTPQKGDGKRGGKDGRASGEGGANKKLNVSVYCASKGQKSTGIEEGGWKKLTGSLELHIREKEKAKSHGNPVSGSHGG